jgi:hypothetical protein
VRIVVDEVALGQGFLGVLRYFPVSIIPWVTHLYLHVAHTRRTNGRRLGIFQKELLFRKSGSIG